MFLSCLLEGKNEMKIIARMTKLDETIKVMRAGLDPTEGYMAIRDTATTQTTELVPEHGLGLYLMMKHVLEGYHWLQLCETCQGAGWRWGIGPDSCGDPVRDVCEVCQGEGGK